MLILSVALFFIQLNTSICKLCSISNTAYDALFDFYNSTNGLHWRLTRHDVPWKFPSSLTAPCDSTRTWVGLNCSSTCDIVGINLFARNLIGTLPFSISSLSNLEYLYVYENGLSGSLPLSLGQLVHLDSLDLYSNFFSQNVPASLGNISALRRLFLDNNDFTGSLPSSIGNLHNLEVLYLFNNYLSNSVPSSFGELHSLNVLYLSSNLFSHSIPSSLGNLLNLVSLQCSDNLLSFSIPSTLGRLTNLQLLYLDYNILSQSIPKELGNLSSLQGLYFTSNHLTGSIPSSLGLLTTTQTIFLGKNFFSYTLPSTVFNLKALEALSFSNNLFTSTIPSIVHLDVIEGLFFDQNYFSGSLPYVGDLLSLQGLYFSDNILSGTLCTSMGSLPKLAYCNVSMNVLDGSIPMWNSSSIDVFDASFNYFSSNFDFIASLTSIQMLSLSQNCFHGHLQSSICSLSVIKTLLLDNLGSNCGRHGIMRSIDYIGGSIPSCLWGLRKLQTLHLTGNGFTGTIPYISNSSSLMYLAAESNRLTGSLPISLQEMGLSSLQLSFNRIAGVLSSNFLINISVPLFSSGVVLSLSSNRLSGTFPGAFVLLDSIDVVDGNIFSCSDFHDDNDVNSNSYLCGSMKLSQVLWFFECIVGVLVILLLLFSDSSIYSTISSFLSSPIPCRDVLYFGFLTKHFVIYVFSLAIFLLIVYSLFSHTATFSTHSFGYGWGTSITLLRGWIPGVFLSFVIVVSMIYIFWLLVKRDYLSFRDLQSVSEESKKIENGTTTSSSTSSLAILIAGGLISMTVMVVVNGVYVYAVLQNMSFFSQFVVSIVISIFKVGWTGIFPETIFMMAPFLSNRTKIGFELFLNVFNFLITPLLVTMVVDVNCFLYSFKSIPSITTYFESYNFTCSQFDVVTNYVTKCIFAPILGSSTIIPPWFYSFQCGSSVIMAYSSIVMYSYIVSGVVIPIAQLFIILQQHTFVSKKTISLFRVFDHILFFPILNQTIYQSSSHFCAHKEAKSRKFLCRFLRHILSLLTFGIASPWIIFMILFTLFTEYFVFRVECGRILTIEDLFVGHIPITKVSVLDGMIDRHITREILFHYLPHCFLLIGIYWAVFLLDIIGDVSNLFVAGMFVIGFELVILGSAAVVFRMWNSSLS